MATGGEIPSAAPVVGWDDQLDPAVLKELDQLGGPDDPEFVSGVLKAFLDETPRQLSALEAALAGGDPTEIAKCAHALKGSGRGIGATRLMELTFALEQKGRAGRVSGGKLLLAQIKAALGAVSETVKKEISQRRPSPRK